MAGTGDSAAHQAETIIATVDFGTGVGLYDFTANQWHNQLRARRIVVRGSHGEIVDDTVYRLADERTFISSPLIRRQLGYDLDLDGYDTDHISFNGDIVYRNPYIGLRLADDEIAVASLLSAVAKWCRQEPGPLPPGRWVPGPPHIAGHGCQPGQRRFGHHHDRRLGGRAQLRKYVGSATRRASSLKDSGLNVSTIVASSSVRMACSDASTLPG